MEILKRQHTLKNVDSVQIFMPKHIRKFARDIQDSDDRPRKERPNLPDIYVALAESGLKRMKAQRTDLIFTEIGRQNGSVSAQIKYPKGLNDKMKKIHERTKISVLSIFVTLIDYEIQCRATATE